MGKFRKRWELAKFVARKPFLRFDVPQDPHFDEESTSFFERELSKARSYVEYGSGGSTRMADRLRVPTISIEGDRHYAKAVRKTLTVQSTVDLRWKDIGVTGFWSVPVLKKLKPARLRRWLAYVEAPFKRATKDGFPDFVLVDGRFRVACALEAVRSANQAGQVVTVMFDDYATPGRDYYRSVETLLGAPQMAGRAAIFRSDASKTITKDDVAEAVRDYR